MKKIQRLFGTILGACGQSAWLERWVIQINESYGVRWLVIDLKTPLRQSLNGERWLAENSESILSKNSKSLLFFSRLWFFYDIKLREKWLKMVRKAKNAKPEKPDKRQRTINTFFTKSGDKKQIKHPNGGVFKMRGKGWFLFKKLSHLNDRINYFKNLKWVFLSTSCQILTLTEVIE